MVSKEMVPWATLILSNKEFALANWRRFHDLNGGVMLLNLDLAFQIKPAADDHTWVFFTDGEGVHSVLVAEPPEDVLADAGITNP
jgi:hypothetical protein